MIGVSRCASASAAAASAAPRRSPSSGPSARLVTSIAAVSTASWLVAPWCTGASVSSRRRSTTGPAGFPISAAPAPIASRSKLLDLRGRDDRPGVLDHARPRLRVRERALEVQQRLQPRAAGHALGDAAAREHAREDVRA